MEKPNIESLFGKIHCADCLTFMKSMPDNCIDLIITSPPYNFGNNSSVGNKYSGKVKDDLKDEDYFNWQSDCITEMCRVSKMTFYNTQFIAGNKIALMNLCGRFSQRIKEIFIWDKIRAEPAINEGVANSMFEFIFVFGEGGRQIKSSSFKKGTFDNILRIPKNCNNTIRGHHACFPFELPAKLIKNFSQEGDIICDPFLGSGTTILAAEKLNRKWIGVDNVPEFCKISQEIIDAEKRQLKIDF